MEKQYVDHFIRIDEMMELRMSIPVHLNVLELKALMYKADKLFKLSEVKIMEHKIAGAKRSYNMKNRKQNVYNKDVIYDLVNLKMRKIPIHKITGYLNEKYGKSKGLKVTASQLHSKWHYQKKSGHLENYYDKDYEVPAFYTKELPSEPHADSGKKTYNRQVFTDAQADRIKELLDAGETATPIHVKINSEFGTSFTRQQITSKIKYIRDMKKEVKPRPKKEKKVFGASIYSPEIELVITQLANDGNEITDIRDAVNSQFGKTYTKKQITDKVYNMRKKGKIQ